MWVSTPQDKEYIFQLARVKERLFDSKQEQASKEKGQYVVFNEENYNSWKATVQEGN